MPSKGNSGASNSTLSAPRLNMATALSQLDSDEEQFISDVIKDMLFDAKCLKIHMRGSTQLQNIAEAMAACILKGKGTST